MLEKMMENSKRHEEMMLKIIAEFSKP